MSGVHDVEDGSFSAQQRRIRHVTAIQVRNLTPYPVRDAFASALAQPSEQSQFSAHGHLSDDLDLTLSRRRSRRISANSINTLWSMRSEEGSGDDANRSSVAGVGDTKGRRKAGSRVSGGSSTGSPAVWNLPASAAPTIRPTNRHRTASLASSINSPFAGPSSSLTPSAAPISSGASFLTMLPDHSQVGLEKVIKSRLVETFVAVTVLPVVDRIENSSNAAATSPTPVTNNKDSSPLRPKSTVSNGTTSRLTSKPSPLKPTDKTPIRASSASPRPSPTKTMSTSRSSTTTAKSSRLNGKLSGPSSTSKRSAPPSPVKALSKLPSSPLPPTQTIPDYLSAIHRPSTNPSFSFDARSGCEFADWTDLSADRLKVELWGKVGVGWRGDGNASANAKGKQREREEESGKDDSDWKVLEEWNISLANLVPLPSELASHTSRLPSNTLLVTLNPPGQTFYLPPHPRLPSRAPTPSAGYTSDPESEVRRVKQAEGHLFPTPAAGGDLDKDVARSRRRLRRGGGAVKGADGECAKTAAWQDLLESVTLQSCILDNRASLSAVIREIDKVIKGDAISVLRREVSERECRVGELGEDIQSVKDASERLRGQIEARRKNLADRREMLALAKEQHDIKLTYETEEEAEGTEAREQLRILRANLRPTRTTLLTTLSSIFPIELSSPPDLLYTILDVPLPIPLSSADPAPPLSLASHKEVTEDAVATALGYVAQVVQLLAAYLGKSLIYPVTCVGSRSLIKDGISAMIGPRMFPLYIKGVDTYRFEYGVFLLNKDIEMIMTDMDLRALDMRHTLPNLKNVLLTLTDGEGAPLRKQMFRNSPTLTASCSVSSLADGSSGTQVASSTPKESPPSTEQELVVESSSTPPGSGTTTPTSTVPDTARKSRAFLGLSPLAGFFRAHYPSASGWSSSVKSVLETAEEVEESDDGSEEEETDEEEDRRTIRGVVIGGDEPEGRKVVNGHGNVGEGETEKMREEANSAPLLTAPPLVVTHAS